MRRLLLPAVTILLCGAISGCGLISVHQEARRYHEEQRADIKRAFDDCRRGNPTQLNLNHGHAAPDCFDFVLTDAPRRIEDKPSTEVAVDAYGYIDRFAFMALFSEMVYHRYEKEQDRSNGETCIKNIGKHPLNNLYTDELGNKGRWKIWDNPAGCRSENGLYFETYVYHPFDDRHQEQKFTEAVIVFRGTENYRGQQYPDWRDNFSAAWDHVPDQYLTAERVLKDVIKELKAVGAEKDLKIYTAGHSLGGGLAQMAAYDSFDIKAAYTFNSSPVTGWTWLREKARKSSVRINDDPIIYRVSQRGEGLGLLRAVSSAVNSRRFGRSDYEFDFLDPSSEEAEQGVLANLVPLHDIGLLACNMAARVAMGHKAGEEAEFHFTPELALRVLLQQDHSQGMDGATLCTCKTITQIKKAICGNPTTLPEFCLKEQKDEKCQ